MTKPLDFAGFMAGVPQPDRLAPLRALLTAATAENDFSEQSLESMGAGRQTTPTADKYSARARTRLLVTMARDLLRAEQLLNDNYETYRANLLGSVVDRPSALLAAANFTPADSLQFPLTYSALRQLFTALVARVRQFGVEPPTEWAAFADGDFDPSVGREAATQSS